MVDPIVLPIVIIVASCVTGTTSTGLFLFRFIPWLKENLHDAFYDKIIIMRGDALTLFAAVLLAITKKSEALSKKCILSVTMNGVEQMCFAPPVGEYIEMDDFYVTCVSRSGADIDGLCVYFRAKNEGKARRFLEDVLANKPIPIPESSNPTNIPRTETISSGTSRSSLPGNPIPFHNTLGRETTQWGHQSMTPFRQDTEELDALLKKLDGKQSNINPQTKKSN